MDSFPGTRSFQRSASMIFLTGVPGFLGTRLLRALAEKYPDATFGLLVQPKYAAQSRELLEDLGLADRAEVFPGDITEPGLGLEEAYDAVAQEVTMACHLAAVYDLSIPYDIGWRINVEGTRHVVEFLSECPRLEQFAYVSTAYVSGERTGTIYEDELAHDAGFKNFYEETKYHAELLVQERMDDIPTSIFRPSIVVGDSETGETDKFDGPYFVLRALQRLPRYTVMARIGSGAEVVNMIPVDFAIDAMTRLIGRENSIDTVYHLSDPEPLTTQEILDLFSELLDKTVAYVPIPKSVARTLMNTAVGRVLGIAPELVDYFDHPSYYDSTNTQDALEGTGISCPSLPDYAPKMVAYMRRHRDVRSEAMY